MGTAMMRVAAAMIVALVAITFIYFVANLIIKAVLVIVVAWLVLRILGIGLARRS